MRCTNCGSNLNWNDRVCPNCGVAIANNQSFDANNTFQKNQTHMSSNINQNMEGGQSINQTDFSNNNFQSNYVNSNESLTQNINAKQQNNIDQGLDLQQQPLNTKNNDSKVWLIILIILGSLFLIFGGIALVLVVAQKQVNNQITDSRTRRYFEDVVIVRRAARTACANDGLNTIEQYIESDDLNVEILNNNVIVTAKNDGKYVNLNTKVLKSENSNGINVSDASAKNNYKVIIENPCNY